MEDEFKNTLGELEFYLKAHQSLPIENKHKDTLNDCRHMHVILDDQNHTVTCTDCKKQLDPFWYLQLLAKEWSHRRYCDTEAIKANKDLKQRRLDAEAKGKIFIKPISGDGLIVWETYEAYAGKEPLHIYKQRGYGWRIVDDQHCDMSFDYLKQQLAYKQRGKF